MIQEFPDLLHDELTKGMVLLELKRYDDALLYAKDDTKRAKFCLDYLPCKGRKRPT